ncbi:hypothetical protein KRP22_010973 [Phytophthora ramorum]|uniref:Glutathione S-transferase n=1 Tax=Phytophthora ramorum TaxID=164328 RepID=H3GNU7_PHYRM|nr:Glutathione S-transferase 1 [Phytophthora ramorum]KAH7504668.1 Glutathione S-transferase 1 [Phytophthora ramorum]
MPAFPTIKLTYFNFTGRAEAARLAFYLGGVPFEDNRMSRDQFSALKTSLPLGQLPVLEVDGEVFTQSSAILRYAGRLGGLYPTSAPFAAAKVDEMLHALAEMGEQMMPSFSEKDEDKKKAMREELATVTLPRYAAQLDARLEKMRLMPVFQSEKVFVHELTIYQWMKSFRSGMIDYISPTVLDGYELLNATFDKVAKHPKVVEWNSLPHDTPKLKLKYFPVPGRAEPIRLTFFIGGIAFEDERLSFDEFAKIKASLPFNQMPVLDVDGEVISQSVAILRYAGTLAGLYPSLDTLAAYRVDEILALIDEMFSNPAWRETVSESDPDKLQKMREGLSAGLIPKTLNFLEKRVAQFDASYATCEHLTVADLAIYAVLLILKGGRPGIPASITDPFQNLQRVFEVVKAHPKVVEWNAAHA